jgi:hypothetical protein
MFSSNLIGVLFARSLHSQFYSWYFHSLPYLLAQTRWHAALKLALFGGIEAAWNVYPSTVWSSGGLLVCHVLVLVGLDFEGWVRRGSGEKSGRKDVDDGIERRGRRRSPRLKKV